MKKYILAFIMLLFSVGAKAQFSISNTSSSPISKWVFGGTAGAGFLGGDGFSISATPTIGYKLTPNLIGGLSGTLSYQKDKYSKSSIWGFGPFLKYYFGRSFYASANYRYYFINQKIKNSGSKFEREEGTLNIGGGYIQHLGGGTFLEIGATYNVLYKEDNSILRSPFTPYVGVIIGL